MVLTTAALLAGTYLSTLLVGAVLLSLAARALGQLRRRAGGRILPPLARQLADDRQEPAVKDTRTPGPEFASGERLLADLIVLRHAPAIPVALHAEVVEGRWWNLAGAPQLTCIRCPLADGSIAVATPSGRFEVDGAGRVAEVWELTSPEWVE